MRIKIDIAKKGEKDNIQEYKVRVDGGDIKKFWKKLSNILENQDKDPKQIVEYIEFVDKLACQITGLSMDNWDKVDGSEQTKLTNLITDKVREKIGFGKPSQKSESSEQKTEQKS